MHQVSQIAGLIQAFSHALWTEEIKETALSLCDQIEQEEPELIRRYLPEVLAAAIVWFSFDIMLSENEDRDLDVPASEICMQLKAPRKDVEDAYAAILDFMDYDEIVGPEEKDDNRDDNSEIDDAQIFDQLRHRAVMRLPLRKKGKLTRERKLQNLKLLEEIAIRLDDSFGLVKILETTFNERNNDFWMTMDIPLGAIAMFAVIAEDKGFVVGKAQFISESKYDELSDTNLYEPSDHYVHFIETYVSWGRDEFSSEQEHKDFMESIKDKTPEELRILRPPTPVAQAWLDALTSYTLPRNASLEEIERILSIDPYCIEAMLCKIGWNVDPESRIDLIEEVIEMGERQLHTLSAGREIHWWTDHNTRPYMRAKEYLGDELMQADYIDDALEVYAELMELNPQDNQGIRYQILAESLLHHKSSSWDIAYRATKNEDTPFVLYCHALHLYLVKGNKSAAKKAAVRAFRSLPYAVLLLHAEEDAAEKMLTDLDEQAFQQTDYISAFLERMEDKRPSAIKWLIRTIEESGWRFKEDDKKGWKLN